MKKKYVKPTVVVYSMDMGMEVLSTSGGSPSITGDIGGETPINSGGSSDNDPDKLRGGDAKSSIFDKAWDEDE